MYCVSNRTSKCILVSRDEVRGDKRVISNGI